MKQINFRVTTEQYEQLKKQLENTNYKTITSYAKDLLLKKKVKIFKDFSTYKNLLKEINKIGINLNQISKYCNSYKNVDTLVLEELKKINKQLNKLTGE